MIHHMIIFNNDNKPPESKPVRAEQSEESASAMVSDKITLSDGATIDNTPEAIHQYNEMRKAVFEKIRQREAQRQSLDTGKQCPFQYDENSGHARPCKRECVFFDAESDSCKAVSSTVLTGTLNKMCPFMRKCIASCALYRGGCSLMNYMSITLGKKV